jgi:hypothetical protein
MAALVTPLAMAASLALAPPIWPSANCRQSASSARN